MTFISPIADRKRGFGTNPVADGEYVGFDLAFMDAAAKAKASVSTYLTDAASRSKSLAAARYGDSAVRIDMAEGSTRAIGGTVSASAPAREAGQSRPAVVDALRASRYGSE